MLIIIEERREERAAAEREKKKRIYVGRISLFCDLCAPIGLFLRYSEKAPSWTVRVERSTSFIIFKVVLRIMLIHLHQTKQSAWSNAEHVGNPHHEMNSGWAELKMGV
jgi:hypothetical protein